MSAKKSSKESWLEYITKLNDRELRRQQASTLLSLASLSVIVALIFTILENLPTIFNSQENLSLFLLYFSSIFSILISGIIAFSTLWKRYSFHFERRRFMTGLTRTSQVFVLIPLFFFIFLLAVTNLYVWVSVTFGNLNLWLYYLIGSLFLSQIIGFLVFRLFMKIKTAKEDIELPEIKKEIPGIIYPSINIVILTAASLSLFAIMGKFNVLEHVHIIKLVLEFGLLVVVIFYFFDRLSSSIRHNWLLDLERRILVEELDEDQIRTSFVEEYIGETTLNWLNRLYLKWKEEYKELKKSIEKTEREKNDASDLMARLGGKLDELVSVASEEERSGILSEIDKIICSSDQNLEEIIDSLNESIRDTLEDISKFLERRSKDHRQLELLQLEGAYTEDEKFAIHLLTEEWEREDRDLERKFKKRRESSEKFKNDFRNLINSYRELLALQENRADNS